jgi:hypothetical protein
MQLSRLKYDPRAVLDFFDQGLAALGALSERTWHDRLEIIAEGRAAGLWNEQGAMFAGELRFAPPDAAMARDAGREVFPGCPLTFRLAEALRPTPLPLERLVLAEVAPSRPPDAAVAEKLWRGQFPETARWRLLAPFQASFHFSLLVLVRCEVQAIDQHWSLRRLAVSLPDGELDENLAAEIPFAQAEADVSARMEWPAPDPARWSGLLEKALQRDLADDIAAIRARQENSLRRELERIDDYFEKYEEELTARAGHSGSENVKLKIADRLNAAKTEHLRRRADQVARHEIRIGPQIDALLMTAEKAWYAPLETQRSHAAQAVSARFVPRSRRWFV